MNAFPKSLVSIVASVGALAVFLVLASWFMVSQPIGPTISRYFYGVNNSENFDSLSLVNVTHVNSSSDGDIVEDSLKTAVSNSEEIVDQPREKPGVSNEGKVDDVSLSANETVKATQPNKEVLSSASPVQDNISKTHSGHSDCDLYHGQWIYDPTGPLYSNSCPVLTQMQNCQRNGRPDKEYENWRWKPENCDLPRFDPKKFLELMRGKTLAFVGDSVARNQMESLLCILWQVEVPKNRGNRRMHRYYFRSTSTMIVRIWSSWLVHNTPEPFDFAPAGVDKVFLDTPDNVLMEFVPQFDVIVLSSGHWFGKKSAYIMNNEILGGQLWWPNKSRPKKVNNVEAYGISVETILTSLGTHPNYTGLAIVRSYSPDHYMGGAWNTGGSCTGKVKPALASETVENGFTKIMHSKQVNGFNLAIKKKTNKSKFRLMDITEAFSYRHDGHPGPYRSPEPIKETKRGKRSRPQDCLHWCMPGPVDTWNELMLEIITREYEADTGLL
ncbi:Trichome birefringence-like [Heracleum sosnowskyi]|uniref:Trichome birefringence-like n=1 Tax=Heracleum sosnowskyi TaxID=360622 RepID=A0AAD8H7J3_9APIA|nr:Trichome birefringence-like [Heracleum sosnowskyi]